MLPKHYTADGLKKIIRDCIIRQEWEDSFAPPEGQAGRGGADPWTELKGFKRDAEHMIQAPICDQFPNGGATQEIADALTNLAYSQKNASAGAFARHMLLNIRDRIAPEYLTDKAEKAVAGTSAQDVIAHIESQATSSEAKEVFDNLLIRRQNVTDGTAQDICDALKAIGDEYDRGGDDFLAEEADLLREQARNFIENSTRAAQVQKLAQDWKEQEQTWQKPLAEQLKPAGEKKSAAVRSAQTARRRL